MEIIYNIPKITEKQMAQQVGFPDSTIRRYRDQINMPSPYNRKSTERKKMNSQDGSITVKRGKSEIFSGKELIDEAFIKN